MLNWIIFMNINSNACYVLAVKMCTLLNINHVEIDLK